MPIAITDTHAAMVTSKEIAKGQWQTLFAAYDPERTPLASRRVTTTFVTGNPRVARTFIDALDRALPVHNFTIAHFNPAVTGAWAVFCVPAMPSELRSAGLRINPEAFA